MVYFSKYYQIENPKSKCNTKKMGNASDLFLLFKINYDIWDNIRPKNDIFWIFGWITVG